MALAFAARTPTPPSQARSGEFLKTCHRHVFLTEFHLIGSSPVARQTALSQAATKTAQEDFLGCNVSGAGDGNRTRLISLEG